jgi:hypothetical protein
MLLRFLKRHKFVVEKEELFGHGAMNLNPFPLNLTGVDDIATQLDSQDTLHNRQVVGNGTRHLNSVGEGAISTQLDSHFPQMDSQVDSRMMFLLLFLDPSLAARSVILLIDESQESYNRSGVGCIEYM